MLSIFSNIKNKIINIISSRNNKKRLRTYEVIIGNNIMNVDTSDDDNHDENHNENEHLGKLPPQPSPNITRRLFNLEIDETIIKKDYELQDLLKKMHIYQIDVTNVILESRIENALRDIHDVTDIMKIKVKLLYIIIANNMYRALFEEKKQYRSIKTKQYE